MSDADRPPDAPPAALPGPPTSPSPASSSPASGEAGGDWPTLERVCFALPAGLGTVMFGAGGVALLGAAQLHALRRSHDEALHAPVALVAEVAALGLLWVVTSIGLVRRAPWGRVLAAFLGLADLALTLALAGSLALLPVAGGSPFQRLGVDLLCAALALPWFAPAFRGPEQGTSLAAASRPMVLGPGRSGPASPAPSGPCEIGKAYPAAVAWGTVVFLALAMAPGFATMAKAVSRDGLGLSESGLFRAASVLRESPPVAALLLPLLVLGPLLLVELRGRWAAIAVHLAGATASMLLLNELASIAREVMRKAR